MIAPDKKVKIHFVGIGGIGMSGIAEVLLNLGYSVSGSDSAKSANTEKLLQMGAEIFIGHLATNVQGATVLVFSSAVTDQNPELKYAKEHGIPQMRRAEMLAELMRLKHGIAIAGTHGKTTTTSLVSTIIQEGGLDPTYIIGGIVENLKGHAKVGKGSMLVAEADESDGSFLLLQPIMSVITNIDYDHMDYYGTREKLLAAFKQFANQIPFYGVCALNIHDDNIRELIPELKKPYVTFGVEGSVYHPDFEARNIQHKGVISSYNLFYKGELQCEIRVPIPGIHNVMNSLAAVAITRSLGLSYEIIAKGIACFSGVGRRFQKVFEKGNLKVIDDYGHHPTEIMATIAAARVAYPNDQLVVLFEPHRYTRTRDCWQTFLHCFNRADQVYFLPIYAASEKAIEGISSKELARDINKVHPDLVSTFDSFQEAASLLKFNYTAPTILLSLGAGSIGRNVRETVAKL